MRKALPLLMVAIVLGGLGHQPALADPGDRFERREEQRNERRENRMDAGEAARRAQARNGGGRVLDVNPSGDGFRVKLLKDGDVRVIFIPNQ